MLAGVVVVDAARRAAVVFYLAVYLFMNLAAFAVIVARERETRRSATTSPRSYGLGADRPAARVADDDRDAVAGRLPGDGRASSARST